MSRTKRSKAKEFVYTYWFTNEEPSKAVTTILNWIEDNKLTVKGRVAYRQLINNLK